MDTLVLFSSKVRMERTGLYNPTYSSALCCYSTHSCHYRTLLAHAGSALKHAVLLRLCDDPVRSAVLYSYFTDRKTMAQSGTGTHERIRQLRSNSLEAGPVLLSNHYTTGGSGISTSANRLTSCTELIYSHKIFLRYILSYNRGR